VYGSLTFCYGAGVGKMNNSLSPNGQATRLLIVDDEQSICVVLARALGYLGFDVEAVNSGPEALARLAEADYDLMLLDIRMPGMDGMEVMQHVRQSNPELPIIIMTGQGTLESAIAALKLGALDYVLKPVGVPELAAAVEQALHMHGHISGGARPMPAPAGQEPLSPARNGIPQRLMHLPPITLDYQTRLVSVAGDPPRQAELTEGEMAVLSSLMTYPDQVFSCRQLARMALEYDLDEIPAQSVIRPYIFRLRQKIEANPKQPQLIRTVRGRGYMFSPHRP
jgi:DNA-binding response OmpR family regulator